MGKKRYTDDEIIFVTEAYLQYKYTRQELANLLDYSVKEVAYIFKLARDKGFVDPARFDEVSKKKNSQAMEKRWTTPEYRNKMMELYQTEEFKAKLRERNRRWWDDPAYRERMIQMSKDLWQIPEHRKRMEEMWNDPEYREIMREKVWENPTVLANLAERNVEKWKNDDEYRQKMKSVMEDMWKDPIFREKMIANMKDLWQNPEFLEKMMFNSQEPNGVEQLLIDALGSMFAPSEVAAQNDIYYTGNFGFFVNFGERSKNPDFKIKGQRKVIEVHGDYWHSKEFCESNEVPEYMWNEEMLIDLYNKAGYDCKIYWEHEIRDKKRLDQIVEEISQWILEDGGASDTSNMSAS